MARKRGVCLGFRIQDVVKGLTVAFALVIGFLLLFEDSVMEMPHHETPQIFVPVQSAAWSGPVPKVAAEFPAGVAQSQAGASQAGASQARASQAGASQAGASQAGASQAGRGAGRRVGVVVATPGSNGVGWRDSFRVFALAAQEAFAQSAYHMELVAVTPQTTSDADRSFLQATGFTVRVLPSWKPEDITSEFAQEELRKWCCAEVETLKLYAIGFTEFHRVIVADVDLLFVKNFDDLLDDSRFPMSATYDYALDGPYCSVPPIMPSFFVVIPSKTDYDEIASTMREGNFKDAVGWRESGIGWAYGGMGPGGLLSYHYNRRAREAGNVMTKNLDLPGAMSIGPAGTRIKALDRSKHAVIATGELIEAIENNRAVVGDVKTFHFQSGLCEPPYTCKDPGGEICTSMTDRWWQLRDKYSRTKALAQGTRCNPEESYQPLP